MFSPIRPSVFLVELWSLRGTSNRTFYLIHWVDCSYSPMNKHLFNYLQNVLLFYLLSALNLQPPDDFTKKFINQTCIFVMLCVFLDYSERIFGIYSPNALMNAIDYYFLPSRMIFYLRSYCKFFYLVFLMVGFHIVFISWSTKQVTAISTYALLPLDVLFSIVIPYLLFSHRPIRADVFYRFIYSQPYQSKKHLKKTK